MKAFKQLSVGILFSSVVFSAMPAKAGECCNDFWSCAGAVFSAGLSCAAMAAMDEIDNFVRNAQNLQRQGEQVYQNTADDFSRQTAAARQAASEQLTVKLQASDQVKQQADQIAARFRENSDPLRQAGRQIQQQQRLPGQAQIAPGTVIERSALENSGATASGSALPTTNQDLGANTAAGNVANTTQLRVAPGALQASSSGNAVVDRADVLNAMDKAKQEVNELNQKVKTQDRTAFQNNYELASRIHRQSLEHMNQVFVVSFMAPLSGLIAPLLGVIPDPITLAATIGGMVFAINNIKSEFESRFPAAINKAQQDSNDALGSCTEHLVAAESKNNKANEIVAAMQALERNPNRFNLDALNRLTGNTPTAAPPADGPTINPALRLDPAIARRMQIQFSPAITRNLSTSLTALSQEAAAIKNTGSKTQPVSQYQSKMNQQLSSMFNGKNADAVERQRQQMVAEANRKFSKDPSVRDKTIQLINDEAMKYSSRFNSTPVINPAVKSMQQPIQKPMQPINTPQPIKPAGPVAPQQTMPQAVPHSVPKNTVPVAPSKTPSQVQPINPAGARKVIAPIDMPQTR